MENSFKKYPATISGIQVRGIKVFNGRNGGNRKNDE